MTHPCCCLLLPNRAQVAAEGVEAAEAAASLVRALGDGVVWGRGLGACTRV